MSVLQAPPHFEIDAAFEDWLWGFWGGGWAEQLGEQDSTEHESGAKQGAAAEAFADYQVRRDHREDRL